MPRELVLVGGGHAHVEVIRRYGEQPIADTRLTVVDPNPLPLYSGMVPGFVAGQYERADLEMDLRTLCDGSKGDFKKCAVQSVHGDSLALDDGSLLPFDVASLDIGSTVSGKGCPGVQDFALASRPITTLVSEVDKLFQSASSRAPIHVVGGGAGGVELAFCLDTRLRSRGDEQISVALVTSDRVVLQSSPPSVRARVERALKRRGIDVIDSAEVSEVFSDGLQVAGGSALASAGALWVTGPASHPLGNVSRLPTDERGFIRVQPSLLVLGRHNIFAAGDCASLTGMKKAGVYAVRAGPVLDRNIRALLRDAPLRALRAAARFPFAPKSRRRNGHRLEVGLAVEGRWVMHLKDRIDRSFMEKYQ